jgi:hypothetical protein
LRCNGSPKVAILASMFDSVNSFPGLCGKLLLSLLVYSLGCSHVPESVGYRMPFSQVVGLALGEPVGREDSIIGSWNLKSMSVNPLED